jgi:rhamnose transport system substrate-binding protein
VTIQRKRVRRFIGASLAGAIAVVGSFSAGAATPSKPYKLVFIQTNVGNPYNDSITSGLKKAASELGYSFEVAGPAAAGAADQVPIIQDQIAKGVHAILINANDPASVTPALNQAKAAGIKVFSINSDQLSDIRVAAFTSVDYGLVPANQMNSLAKLMGGKGEFAIMSATTTATFQKTVVAAQKALLKSDPKLKNLKLVKVAYGDDDPQKSTTETQALLLKYPKLKAITAPTTVGLAAAAQAVEAAGKGGKIIVTGLGTPNQMRKYVKSGTVKEFQLWDPILLGYVSGYVVNAVLEGKIAGAPGDSVPVPGNGVLKINSSGVVIAQKALTSFNAKNIDKYNF